MQLDAGRRLDGTAGDTRLAPCYASLVRARRLLVCIWLLPACAKSPVPELPEAVVTIPEASATSDVAADEAPLPPRSPHARPGTGADTGIAVCDDFIEKYERCITTSTNMPDPLRDSYRQSIESMRRTWKAAAATPSGRSAAQSTCQQALATMTEVMEAFGCEW